MKKNTLKKLQIRLDETVSGHVQKKFVCPSCGKKRFVRFYDFGKEEYLPERYGRCDRSENCVYYLSPYKDEGFQPDGGGKLKTDLVPVKAIKLNYVEKQLVVRTLTRYDENVFVAFLVGLVGFDRAIDACFKYFIGTAKHGGTIFWQVDRFMMTRTGQLMFYKPDGHRDKTHLPSKVKPYTVENDYRSCLFGEHLLFTGDDADLIGLVESEKSAVLSCLYMPDLAGRRIAWLASSGSNGLTDEKIAALRGRDVLLCPDFSFDARATWGVLPMRKKYVDKEVRRKIGNSIMVEIKPVLVPHPDGELVDDFISVADRLRAIGCNVSFFNPCPDVSDGSDIADMFVQETAPAEMEIPDFGALMVDIQTDETERLEIRPVNQLSLSERVQLLSGRHSLFLSRENSHSVKIRANNIEVKEVIEQKFFKNADFINLVNRFDLTDGNVIFAKKQ